MKKTIGKAARNGKTGKGVDQGAARPKADKRRAAIALSRAKAAAPRQEGVKHATRKEHQAMTRHAPSPTVDEQRQQPVPLPNEPVIEYRRPLPLPGDRDYIAGQPVTEEEADAVEQQVNARMQEAAERREEAEELAREAGEGYQQPGKKHR